MRAYHLMIGTVVEEEEEVVDEKPAVMEEVLEKKLELRDSSVKVADIRRRLMNARQMELEVSRNRW